MKSIQLILLPFVALTFSFNAHALSTDRDQPANIEADDIEFDFRKGIRTYIKNVLIVQGTLRIKADKLITNYENGDLSLATATGSLAKFKQRPDDKPDDVEGSAKKIVVDQKKNILTLYGQASLTQGFDTARGETIIYNMSTDTLKVLGGAKVKTAGTDGQVAPDITEDPFKPAPVKTETSSTLTEGVATEGNIDSTSDIEDAITNNETPSTADSKPVVETVPAGRSRLIIRPK